MNNPFHSASSTNDYYTARILSSTDYGVWGDELPQRSFSSNAGRYGFNGKEKTDEWNGNSGASYDYGFRIYDPRLGRFLSVDPLMKSYPWYTPYQFAGNKPIWMIDLDGLEETPPPPNGAKVPTADGMWGKEWFDWHWITANQAIAIGNANPDAMAVNGQARWCPSCYSGGPGGFFVQKPVWLTATQRLPSQQDVHIGKATTTLTNNPGPPTVVSNPFAMGSLTPTPVTFAAANTAVQNALNAPVRPPDVTLSEPTPVGKPNSQGPTYNAQTNVFTTTTTITTLQQRQVTTYQNVVRVSFNTTLVVDDPANRLLLQQRFDAISNALGNPPNLVYNPTGNRTMTADQMVGAINQVVIRTGTEATTTPSTITTNTTEVKTQTFQLPPLTDK